MIYLSRSQLPLNFMKRLLSSLMAAAGIALSYPIANAQEYPGCFMFNSSGQFVNLAQVCNPSASSPAPAQNSVRPSGTFRIPIKRREGGTPIVEVVFNGKQRFEMLFDTGATHTVITPAMAKALNLKIETSAMVGTAGGLVPSPVGRVTSAQAGGLAVKGLPVMVNPHIPYGLLGQNFYGQYDVAIKGEEILLTVRRK
jgi:aspartyl protease family protein